MVSGLILFDSIGSLGFLIDFYLFFFVDFYPLFLY